MGQQVVTIGVTVAGTAIGAYFGMPQLGFMLGSAVGTIAGSLLFPQQAPASNDTKITGSSYGTAINILYGRARMAGTLIWAGPQKKKGGSGKGGAQTGNMVYKQSFAMSFCEGPTSQLVRVWADGKLIIDQSGLAVSPAFASSLNTIKVNGSKQKLNLVWKFYNGAETQMPDPIITSWITNNVADAPNASPAYRGLCYVMFQDFPISNFGGRIPNITAEIVAVGKPELPAGKVTPLVNGPVQPTGSYQGSATVDWQRNVLYSIDVYSGLHVVDLATGTEIAFRSLAQLGLVGISTVVITCNLDGIIFIANNSTATPNACSIATIHPDSFTVMSRKIDYTTFGLPWDAVVLTPVAVDPQGNGSTVLNYVAIGGPFNKYVLLRLSDAGTGIVIYDGALPSVGYSVGGYETSTFIPGPAPDAVRPSLAQGFMFVYNYAGFGTQMPVFRITVSGQGKATPTSAETPQLTMLKVFTADDFIPGSVGSITFWGAVYDPADGCIIISASVVSAAAYATIKFDPETLNIIWRVSGYALSSGRNNALVSNGTVVLADGPLFPRTFMQIYTATGQVRYLGGITSPRAVVGGTTGFWGVYDSQTQVLTASSTVDGLTPIQISFGHVAGATTSLASVVTDICVRSGLQVTDLDTTRITQNILGYVVSRSAAGKDLLAQLSQPFFFDAVESDYVLRFVPKNTAPVTGIYQQDLASTGSSQDGQFFQHKRVQTIETPVRVHVMFKDPVRAYETNTAAAKRISGPVKTVYGKQTLNLDIPVSMNEDTAKSVAEQILYTLWTERDSYESNVGWQYSWLDPSDAVVIALDNGDEYTLRILSSTLGANYHVKLAMIGQDITTFTQFFTGQINSYAYDQKIPSGQGQGATPLLLNVPLLRDGDDTGGTTSRIYYAAGAYALGWTGGSLLESLNGSDFTLFGSITNAATWGVGLNALAPTSLPFSTDTTNTLTISISQQQTAISSASYLDFLQGKNAMLVGREIIFFQNASFNSDGTITLSTLLRGQRGTDWACNGHIPGERCVLLNTSDISRGALPLSQVNSTTSWKLVSNGQFTDQVRATGAVFNAYDLRPYAPTEFKLVKVGSSRQVIWQRRSRFAAPLLDGLGTTALGEAVEQYDAYVMAAPYDTSTFVSSAPSTYVRAYLALTSPTFTYLQADMATDGFIPTTGTLHLVVFQRSAVIGVGFPGAADLPPLP